MPLGRPKKVSFRGKPVHLANSGMVNQRDVTVKGAPGTRPMDYEEVRSHLDPLLDPIVAKAHICIFDMEAEPERELTPGRKIIFANTPRVRVEIKVELGMLYFKLPQSLPVHLPTVILEEAGTEDWNILSRLEKAQHVEELRRTLMRKKSGLQKMQPWERNRFRLAWTIEELKVMKEDFLEALQKDATDEDKPKYLGMIKDNWGVRLEDLLPTTEPWKPREKDYNLKEDAPMDGEHRHVLAYLAMLSEALPGQSEIAGEALCAIVIQRKRELGLSADKLLSMDVMALYDDMQVGAVEAKDPSSGMAS
ncbi:hypothetical protein K491DRAFT_676882 [Lophiostoma macrostomum CBS 122681]|uniref:Uncharacterized protein n=1 Tax=Lophiostoma macrostomum CBS 122681 TaxID=1314788 RepID=A0A6A6TDZ6_9PLEO|nr:hypothetical protein K491DRAFT_676882 [Lophiostoma macrostomum CBS 122681]